MNASAPLDHAPPARRAPLALWRVAEAFMHTLHALFGAPEDVAAAHTLTRAARTSMASWIRCAEAMLRRLLLIEAAALPKPDTRLAAPKRRAPPPHAKRQRVRKLMSFTADKPEAWRVSFRCFEASTVGARRLRRRISVQAHGDAKARPAAARSNFRSAWPLAERYEALIRVFSNPEPYARRLARKLRARPHRIRDIFRGPQEARHRVDRYAVLTTQAEAAAVAFNSS